jgi:tetratricopeptide (TPR) repeat protein
LGALLPGPGADVISQVGAAVALFGHGMSSADPISLRMTVALFEEVVAATPPRHREFPLRMGYLVGANLITYRMTGDPRSVDVAIELSRRCLEVLPRRHPDRSWFLAAVASAQVARLRLGSLGDLRDAISVGELALRSRERRIRFRRSMRRRPGHPFLEMLADLAHSYELSPFRTQLQADLGYAYELRYRLAREPKDLDRAIALRERAAAEAGRDDPDLLAGTASGYLARFDRTGEIGDLRRALTVAERFMALADPGHPDRELGAALVATARHLPASGHLDPAMPPPEPGGSGFLKRLWLAHLAPAVADDTDADETAVDAVIALGEAALTVTGIQFALDETVTGLPNADDPATDRTLIQLSGVYTDRFARSGRKPDIDRAVALVELMSSLDHGRDLMSAGRVYKMRFTVSRSTTDLETAVDLYEKALQGAGREHPDRVWIMHELADAYRAVAKASGREESLRRGEDLSEQALAEAPPDDPVRVWLIAAVADTHYQRFGHSEDLSELDRAIDLYRQAVAVRRDPLMLVKLGTACHSRFRSLGDLSDLRLAIENYGEMLAWRSADDTVRTLGVANYCLAYRDLFDAAPQEVDTGYLDTLAEVCTAPVRGLPMFKAVACHAVGSLALAMGRPQTAVRVLDQAVDLLRTVAWREIDWPDQEAHLGGIQGLAGEAVAAHLAVDDPAGAVEVAERGRAVILGSELDIRADLADLAATQPALAQRLGQVRDRLNAPMLFDLVGVLHDTVGRSNRGHLWTEHDRLVEQVRHLPGFADFLRPASLARLRPAADGGAVVLVNATAHRGDAVIVTGDADPVPVALPRLILADVRGHVEALLDATSATSLTRALRARRVLTDVLGWLWESTVEPVITTLSDGQREPRVWWLPTGLLGLLPLHAAGVAGQPGALDLAVSSYIPTLRALQHARQRGRPTVRKQLTVALEHRPGFPRLPGTTAEAAALHARHPDHPLLADADATATNVQAALADCTWAHFACHASVDLSTSARAVLHLYGSDLPVAAISRMRLDTGELAYLSACSTAARGLHTDEPITLASAFQLAGFRHVVASLWPLTDRVAAHAAQLFYQTLGVTTAAHASHAAQAVRTVARELRAQHPDRPDLWAALIHSGP